MRVVNPLTAKTYSGIFFFIRLSCDFLFGMSHCHSFPSFKVLVTPSVASLKFALGRGGSSQSG